MKASLKVLGKRVTSTLRSPLGMLVFCMGLLSVGYVLQPTMHFVSEEVRTFIVDRKEGEEFYIDDEDYIIMEKMPRGLDEGADDVDEQVSEETPSLFNTDKTSPTNNEAKSIEQLSWQEVVDANDEMYVYAAYYDVNFRFHTQNEAH